MIISLKKLKKQSADRPEGYYEDVVANGVVIGDQLQISIDEFNRLKRKYNPPSEQQKCGCCGQVQ